MDERVAENLEDGTVQLGLATYDFQLQFFAELLGEVAHHSRHPLEDPVYREHPGLHDLVLEFGSNAAHPGNPFQHRAEILVFRVARLEPRCQREELGSIRYLRAHQVEEFVQPGNVHTDGCGLFGGNGWRCLLDPRLLAYDFGALDVNHYSNGLDQRLRHRRRFDRHLERVVKLIVGQIVRTRGRALDLSQLLDGPKNQPRTDAFHRTVRGESYLQPDKSWLRFDGGVCPRTLRDYFRFSLDFWPCPRPAAEKPAK